jgi:DNA repair exonuclease SbcCD ATPase subunit
MIERRKGKLFDNTTMHCEHIFTQLNARAIRERTRNQIEALERRIRELTSQQPYQELQHVLRQKEAVEAENIDIKKRLASVLSVIQPLLSHQQHGEKALNCTFRNFLADNQY